MNKIALILSGVAAMVAVAVSGHDAQAQSWGGRYNNRGYRQQGHYQQYQAPVYQGQRQWGGRGNINPYEAAQMQRTQAHMQRAQWRAGRDGVIDPYEAARLQQMQQMQRRQAMHFHRNGF